MAGVKRAVRREGVREPGESTWHCYHDDYILAVRPPIPTQGQFAYMHQDLVPLGRRENGLEAYGLTDRSRLRRRSKRGGRRDGQMPLATLPTYVYCPMPGCGRGQRVD
jgi:hypothetical protein